MEENNNYQEQQNINQEVNSLPPNAKKHVCFENHCWKMCLAMVLSAFIGGFLAVYFVADQMFQRHNPHHFNPRKFEQRMFKDMERMYAEDMRAFDEMFKIPHHFHKMHKMHHNDFGMPFFTMDTVKIKSEYDDDKFNIIVCLKPFQGDESKVNYNLKGRKLTVFGKSQVKDKEYEQDIEFSQDFILPENADMAKISKKKEGNKLIISVPMKD